MSRRKQTSERRRGVDGWWDEIEREVDRCLRSQGDCTLAELGRQLGMSESATASLICVLAADGKVRIARVAAATHADRFEAA
jgi:hypothetical protein